MKRKAIATSGTGEARKRIKKTPSKRKAKLVTRAQVSCMISKVQEHKYLDTQGSIGPSYAGSLQQLASIPQGDTDSTRDADSCLPVSLHVKGFILGSDSYNLFRVVIIRWLQNTAFYTPAIADIFQVINTSYASLQQFNKDKRSNFEVLYDNLDTLTGSVGTTQYIKKYEISLPLAKGRPIQWVSGSTTSGTNHIYIVSISDSAVVSHPSHVYQARVNFTDS